MTDNEIIKALECCSKPVIEECCSECPYHLGGEENCHKLLGDIIDLINRKQGKIEALQMDNAQLQSDVINTNMNCEYADKEVIRLQAERDFYYKTLVSQQNTQSETALNYGAFQEARQTAIMKHIQSDNIRLEELLEEADVNYNKCAKRFYKEAIKEFARKLKCGVPQETGVISCADIDNLVKEMVGDTDD